MPMSEVWQNNLGGVIWQMSNHSYANIWSAPPPALSIQQNPTVEEET